MPKINVESDLPKLEKVVEGLDKDAKKLGAAYKKKSAEFETMNGALWEGKNMIEDNQKQLKKEKDTKKAKTLLEEIEEQEKTFKKMSAKLPAIRKDAETMISEGATLFKSLSAASGDVTDMEKALTRTAGDINEMKEWSKTLKELSKTIEKAIDIVRPIKDDGLPNTPKL